MINRVNLVLSWISIFVLSWLLITRKLPVDSLSLTFFVFFLIVAFFAGVSEEIKKKRYNK